MIYADDNVHEALEKVAAKLTRTELGLIEKYIASKGVQRVKPGAAQGTLGSRFGDKYRQLSNTGRRKAKTGDWQNLGTQTKVASGDNIHAALEKVAGIQAAAYRAGKPKLLAAMNARTPSEMWRLGGQYKKFSRSSLGKQSTLGKGTSRNPAMPKQVVQLDKAAFPPTVPERAASAVSAFRKKQVARIKDIPRQRAAAKAKAQEQERLKLVLKNLGKKPGRRYRAAERRFETKLKQLQR